jgi:UDP-N-acetylglucosamine:LPS N-acetylglucosamine transferase
MNTELYWRVHRVAPVEETPGDPAGHRRHRFRRAGHVATRHVDRYFVALEETRVHMERLGVPPATITVSGIPIDHVFAESKDARAMRAKHGLAPDRATILVSAGGFGVGPVEALVHSASWSSSIPRSWS